MQCERCKKKTASVHITQFINGKKNEKHLCEECAREEKLNLEFPKIPLHNLNELLGAFFNQPLIAKEQVIDDVCPNCKSSYSKIAELGRVACSECYRHFSSYLEPALRKIHGTNLHRGKIPRQMGASFRINRELDDLKMKLRQAVEKEEYEKAAEIRDRIKALQSKIDKGEV
jgi:protein arginine kinase activator